MMRNDEYPLPSNAVSVWTNGSELFIGVPPRDSDTRPHTLRIPLTRCGVEQSSFGKPLASQVGWQVLLDLLKARLAGASEPNTIGTVRAPIQYDLDGVMRALTRFDTKGRLVQEPVDPSELGL